MSTKPSRKALRKQATIETLSNFDDLPDSAFVRPQVIAAHADISMATFWRRVKDGRLPAPHDGRVSVGEYRQIIASRAVA